MKLPARRHGENPDFARATRFIWTRLSRHTIQVNTPDHSRGGQRVILSITHGVNKTVRIDLTALTYPELLALRETINIATEVAEPICQSLDNKAAEKMNHDGDDSDERIYRPLPTVVVRKGTLREYDQGILDRRKDVLSGVQYQLLPGGRPKGFGSNLDNREEDDSVAEDDAPSNGEPS